MLPTIVLTPLLRASKWYYHASVAPRWHSRVLPIPFSLAESLGTLAQPV